jgi:uncharacterized coiled-coil protein SlyX
MNINNKLNIIINKKNRIEENVISLKERKSQVGNTLNIVSTSSKIDVDIKELQIDKQISTLNKESKLADLESKFELQTITLDEYNQGVNDVEKQYQDENNLIDDKIETLQTQKENSNPYKNIDKKIEKNRLKKESTFKNIRKNRTKSVGSIGKFVTSTATTALSLVVSKLIYSQMTSSNTRVGKLDTMVEDVNGVIDSIQTKDDIKKARNLRNNALKVLNDVESALIKIKKIVDSINKIVKVLIVVVKVLKIASNIAPPLIKGTILSKLNKAEQILGSIQVVLSAASGILSILINLVDEIREKLKLIGDLLDALIQDPSKINSGDLKLIVESGYGKLGMLEETYKDWRFEIKEEFNSNFVVQGNKRRYAVAINKDNTPVLKSQASFTLDPDVLVGELKLIIDEQNLKP